MIACDANQLHRIQSKIADMESRPAADQLRGRCMLEALHAERRKLMGREMPVSRDVSVDRPTVSLEMALALGTLP